MKSTGEFWFAGFTVVDVSQNHGSEIADQTCINDIHTIQLLPERKGDVVESIRKARHARPAVLAHPPGPNTDEVGTVGTKH